MVFSAAPTNKRPFFRASVEKSPIETFTNWVKIGKDEGMEKNHKEPVKKIIELILLSKKKFSIIDAGCGNGWAVRLISSHKNCLFK